MSVEANDLADGEVERARYRKGRLVLTDRRVHAHGRFYGDRTAYVRLQDVTAATLTPRWVFDPWLLSLPFLVLGVSQFFGVLVFNEDILMYGLFGSLGLLFAMPLHMAGLRLCVLAGHDQLQVRVPFWAAEDARVFLHQVEAARHAAATADVS